MWKTSMHPPPLLLPPPPSLLPPQDRSPQTMVLSLVVKAFHLETEPLFIQQVPPCMEEGNRCSVLW